MHNEIFTYEVAINKELPLTNREKEILMYLAKGLQYREIASELYISFETVKSHVTNIYSKLKVNNRTEAILKYMNFSKENMLLFAGS